MGEFTIANLAAFHTFPIFIQYVNETAGVPGAAVTLMSFGITWAAMLLAARRRAERSRTSPDCRRRRRWPTSSCKNLHRDFGPVKALNGIEVATRPG